MVQRAFGLAPFALLFKRDGAGVDRAAECREDKPCHSAGHRYELHSKGEKRNFLSSE